jgi:predicted amidophosphoribosyltransferase
LPEQTVVVPIPTVPSHIRERGYDHALLLAKIFAKSRGLKMRRLLYRKTSTRQREASRETRMIQAQQAFELRGRLELDRPHLIIDDVITTGATVEFAAKILKDAGVHEVWVAAVARQPLD